MKRQIGYILCAVIVLAVACSGKPPAAPAPPATDVSTLPPPTSTPSIYREESPDWFRSAVLYEIYPRSFYDANGDGMGDLRGITAKLDYVQSLGANTLWLTPVFSSTSQAGFDVMDYSLVAPGLGTKQDLIDLLQQAHNRKMHVILELPIAYTSNEFAYFKDAYGQPKSAYGDWYQWTNAARTAYKSYANLRNMPLLNHSTKLVQEYLARVAQDWLHLGVDGFRLTDSASAPHEFWQVFRQAVKQTNPGAILIGDVWDADPKKLAPYFADEFDALPDVPLYLTLAGRPDANGGGLLNGRVAPASLDTALNASKTYSPTAQLVRFAGAYNTNRVATLVSQNAARQRIATVLLLTLPGVPLIYYGDEIGMPGGVGMGSLGDEYRRAPMDWYKAGKGDGMATWFKDAAKVIRPDDKISVEEQQAAQDSQWNLYKLLIGHHTQRAALRGANWQSVASACKTCAAYLRWDANDFYLVAFNFSDQTQSVTLDLTKLPRDVSGAGKDLMSGGTLNLPSNGRLTLTMTAWDARVLHWGK